MRRGALCREESTLSCTTTTQSQGRRGVEGGTRGRGGGEAEAAASAAASLRGEQVGVP